MIFLLLVFLRVRVYYGIKLIRLTNVFYSYTIIEKNYLGIFGVILMIVVMIRVINLYVSLILSLSLEILSYKIMIYFLILIFLLLRVLMNINFKFNTYDKIKRFKEVWSLDVYKLDQYVYWTIRLVLGYVSKLRNVKLVLVINWWVVVFVLVLL